MEMIKKQSVLRQPAQILLDVDIKHCEDTLVENSRFEDHLPKTTKKDVLINLLSGSLAGAVAKTTIAPLDRTKINFQIHDQKFSYSEAFSFMKNSFRNQGLLSLWRGNSATMARIVPYAGIQYTAHELWKDILKTNHEHKESSVRRFAAGSLAGVISSVITYPLDLARARMAVTHRESYNSLFQVFVRICKDEGVLKLYRGLTPSLLGVIPYAGTSFYTYETLKNRHKKYVENARDTNPGEKLLFGALAGLFGQSMSYPLDIVRRRMQTSNITGTCYNGTWDTMLKIFKSEGLIGGLYKGLSMNWLKGPIAVGISFTIFDISKKNLKELYP